MNWDVFISHAYEEKEKVAIPLANALRKAGISVWLDKTELKIGDKLHSKIEEGLLNSKYGIVILSHAFFNKHFAQHELEGLAQKEVNGEIVILPVWYEITLQEIRVKSLTLSNRIGINWDLGINEIVKQIVLRVRPESVLKPTVIQNKTPEYSILREWKPNKEEKGLGIDIFLKSDLSKTEIEQFILELSFHKDPIIIRVFTSIETYRKEQNNIIEEDFNKNYLLFYVKNTTGRGPYNGFHEIRWMQEIGKFQEYFGKKTIF